MSEAKNEGVGNKAGMPDGAVAGTDAMNGKTVLVTGGTFGIGRETALGLARLGAQVVIVGRDAQRTQAAAQWIAGRLPQGGAGGVKTELADLSSQRDIRELAQRLRDRYDHLDVLVNNAGGLFPKYRRSVDGFEMTWALNHLGYFLLTQELLPLLKAAGSARIVNVVSKLHKRAGAVFYDPQWDTQGGKGYKGSVGYARSKLGNILFTYALARQLAGSAVTVNCVSPGIVGTGLSRNTPFPQRLFLPLFNRIALTPEQGALTSIYVASSPELEGISGRYFAKNAPIESSPESYDESLQKAMWELSLEQTAQG